MRLTILGGGGFRVPLVHKALLSDHGVGRISDVVLHDVDPARLAVAARVLAEQADGVADAPSVRVTTDLDEAITGTDFVFSAIRVGGLDGRAVDERVALSEGVLGQETVGAGGVSFGLRTAPVAEEIARRVAALAPQAWVINFTNPAGLVTEVMARHLGDRVIGICDSPVGLGRRVALALGLDPASVWLDYAGLNHLGWLRGVYSGGVDQLPRLLADSDALDSFEEGKLFGADWVRTLGAVPNEYLYYYYFTRESVAAAKESGQPRGAFLKQQQQRFYAMAGCDTGSALAAWRQTLAEREATYMADSRETAGIGTRDASDLTSGGYEQVALALMRAIAHDERTTLILNVRNRSTLHVLDDDAVIEVPCVVDANGARPVTVSPLADYAAGLVASVKAVDRSVIEAATTGSRAAALRAFAIHPLIDSVTVARRILDDCITRHPQLAYLA